MAENNGAGQQAGGNAQDAAAGPTFQLQRCYLKDASLELPHAPRIFLEQQSPSIDVQLEVSNSSVLDGIYEVVVRVTATAKLGDKVLFLAEGKQAGIFEIRNVPPERPRYWVGTAAAGAAACACCCASRCWYSASKLISARWIGGSPVRLIRSATLARRYG